MANKMRKKELENIVQEFKVEIRKFVGSNLKRLLLFGSYARGDAVEGSDIDLLLIFDSKVSSDTIRKIREVSNSLSLKYDVVISEFYLTEEEFQKHKTPFLLNVKKEGILV
jgi:predicted nucleotidyltransferase